MLDRSKVGATHAARFMSGGVKGILQGRRDTFTIPKSEYAVLNDLKQRAAQLSQGVKKSELLRAGIKALAAMSEAAFLTALQRVPAVKTGRPAPSN